MNSTELQEHVNRIVAKSRISLFFTVVLIAFAAYGVFYYTTKIAYLSGEVSDLQLDIKTKTEELRKTEEQYAVVQKRMTQSLGALDFLQEGSRYLLNRQYAEAIERFEKFLEVHPDSPEALNFLGYSELRYAQFWKENLDREGISHEQKLEYENNRKKYYILSLEHLRKASAKPAYSWPAYNMAILQYQAGFKDEGLDILEELLGTSPFMIRWLCDDGQFRKLRVNRETSDRFVEIVSRAMEAERKASCWVIKDPK